MPHQEGQEYPLKELLTEYEMRLVKQGGQNPLRIIDNKGHTIVYIAGHPEDFNNISKEVLRAFEAAEYDLYLNAAHTHHWHSNFGYIATGISFGGGQMRLGNLHNTANNKRVMERLFENWAIQCMVQFVNKAFVAVHPELWLLYRNLLDNLTTEHPYLSCLFTHEQSVFAASTLNVGGVMTQRHCDHLNLGPGACPFFAIGDFNHTQGRHLILWDLKLVIEFPSGSLIIIPSALLEHLNIPISKDETRYSFTQYSAAGLFRWVDNGYHTDKDLEE